MKKLHLFAVSMLFLTVNFATISCSSSDDDSNTPEEQPEETTYDYFPLALNNVWDYSFTGGNDVQINLYTTTDFEGETYFITDFVNPVDGSDMTQGYRVDGSTYYGYNGETSIDYDYSGIQATATIDPAAFVLFDDTMEVNESITTNVSAPTVITAFGMTVDTTTEFEFIATLVSEGMEMTVNDIAYSDVIKVHLVVNTNASTSNGFTEELDYYFANNIGPIQLESSLGDYTLLTHSLN